MADASVTNTFVASTTAVAAQVNTNFSDLVNYINARNSGGTKWDALAVLGNSILDGSLSVGGTLTVGGSLIGAGSDGWNSAGETWTYASASTFTISGDKTSLYSVGDKIKFTQSAVVRYYYIVKISYSNPNTTVTVGTYLSSTIDNLTISSPSYSKATSPSGFPGYFKYNMTQSSGFSGTPTTEAMYTIQGKLFTLFYYVTGTSNSSNFVMNLPFTIDVNPMTNTPYSLVNANDNGSPIYTASARMGSATLSIKKDANASSWTSSGTKTSDGVVNAILG